jgi:hypothetical protein
MAVYSSWTAASAPATPSEWCRPANWPSPRSRATRPRERRLHHRRRDRPVVRWHGSTCSRHPDIAGNQFGRGHLDRCTRGIHQRQRCGQLPRALHRQVGPGLQAFGHRRWSRFGHERPVRCHRRGGHQTGLTTGPVAGVASTKANLGKITIQSQDAYGNPAVAPAAGTTLTLSSSSAGTRLFSTTQNSAAATPAKIPAGADSITFYFATLRQVRLPSPSAQPAWLAPRSRRSSSPRRRRVVRRGNYLRPTLRL